LNILRPTKFDGFLERGGSTKPWKVFLLEPNGEEVPYVVKTFTPSNIQQQHAVAKEVYGNILAQQFSLPVPEFALVDFDASFIETALDDHARKVLQTKDSGLKFASKLANSMSIVAPVIYSKFLKGYELANVFAFDFLVYNLDRGGLRNKPNLIIDDENFLLIDHEQIFPFADNVAGLYNQIIEAFKINRTHYRFRDHLLYPFLQNMRASQKKHLFDEFEEYLTKMEIKPLENAIDELNQFSVSTGEYDRIINYLYLIKQNPSKFCNILFDAIQ
jgi:hypothetical protein